MQQIHWTVALHIYWVHFWIWNVFCACFVSLHVLWHIAVGLQFPLTYLINSWHVPFDNFQLFQMLFWIPWEFSIIGLWNIFFLKFDTRTILSHKQTALYQLVIWFIDSLYDAILHKCASIFISKVSLCVFANSNYWCTRESIQVS